MKNIVICKLHYKLCCVVVAMGCLFTVSLSAVERFIEENGHLPGMPSAEEIQQHGGVEIGKTQAKLLEKIEELTLHLIRMEKELEKTKVRLNKGE